MSLDPEPRDFGPGNPPVVLIVDDNPIRLDSMSLFLRSEGFLVHTAASGETALRLMPGLEPDLVISDVVMPGMDGFELCRRVKRDASTSDLPVLLVSGLRFDDAGIAVGFEAGADDYLEVDGPVELLVQKTSRLVTLSRERRARKLAEEALRESEERFKKAFSANPGLMVIYGLGDGRFIDVSESFLQITGYQKDEVLGRAFSSLRLIGGDDRRLWETALLDGVPVRNHEIGFTTKSGEPRTGLLSGEILDVSGQKCALIVISDVTERKRLESQLLQAQKMEAVGTLAGGVAHDFNNLLTAIIGYSQLIRGRLEPGDPSHIHLQEIENAAEAAASLTRQLLAFSRKQVLKLQVFKLNSVITETERLLKRVLGEDIELITRLDPELGNVKADPGQIQQVIMNLAVNARDAMPGGGRLTIETAPAWLDLASLGEDPVIRTGNYAVVSVTDTGHGMDKATLSRVFEPFFTTKEQGRGTGLGLSTSYGIVRQSGGNITVYSEPSHGTVFHVYLPLVGEPADQPVIPTVAPRTRRSGSSTILLVEDEETVRALAAEVLRGSGYAVIEASNGAEALALCRRSDAKIDLVVSDMVMPRMSGHELAAGLAALRPDLKVLFMSGYTASSVSRADLPNCKGLIQKPFTPDSLLHRVSEVLDETASAAGES